MTNEKSNSAPHLGATGMQSKSQRLMLENLQAQDKLGK
jgi:hypothetical protein